MTGSTCAHWGPALRHIGRALNPGLYQTLTFDVVSQKLQTQDHWHTAPKLSFVLEFPFKKKKSPYNALEKPQQSFKSSCKFYKELQLSGISKEELGKNGLLRDMEGLDT